MKKIICVLFALLLAVTAFSGCMDKEPTDNDTTARQETVAVTTGEPVLKPDVPDTKYDGYEFNVLVQEEMDEDFLCTESETADPLNDAVLRRNKSVESQLGITINVESVPYSQATTQFKNSVRSGADDYDIGMIHMVEGSALALDGTALPFEKLPYVDLSKPWWDASVKNGFSINNNQMMANGDISHQSFSITSCLFFNKTIFDKYDMEYPYQLVKDGKWTMDALYEMTKGMTLNTDNNSEDDDQYCLVSWWLDVPFSFYYGCGGMYITKDETDSPILNLNKEKDLAILEKISKVLIENKAIYETNINNFPNVAQTFAEGKALFLDAKLSTVESMREMEDSFGFLPVPKFDNDQKEYCSFVNGCTSMLMVPSTCKNPERTSIILEVIASESYNIVTPVLYETYLKRKMTQDAESMDMIDYIVRNRVFDMAYAYMQDGLGVTIRDLIKAKSTDIASKYDKILKSSTRKLETIIEKFNKSLQD